MARTLTEFRDAVAKVQAINESSWTPENYAMEMTRALTVVENARMEWNSARTKFAVLTGAPATKPAAAADKSASPFPPQASSAELLRLGFFLYWPIWLVGFGVIVTLLLRH